LQYFLLSAFRDDKFELLLLRARHRGNSRQGMTQGAKDAQAALDSIRPDGVGDGEEMAAWITRFVSFHGAILRQGVGHRLSNGKK
jgi:hypothetical protein